MAGPPLPHTGLMNANAPAALPAFETPAALSSIEAITAALSSVGYIANRQVATAVYLAHHLRKPVLI